MAEHYVMVEVLRPYVENDNIKIKEKSGRK